METIYRQRVFLHKSTEIKHFAAKHIYNKMLFRRKYSFLQKCENKHVKPELSWQLTLKKHHVTFKQTR